MYRTWRPQTFSDLVGQETVVRTLTTALETGKLAHAYLFSGPRGSGKTSAAKILARCIECVHGPTAAPDNTCENCVAILNGTAIDVQEIDAASNRGVDEIRALREGVKFAPTSMRMKVFIIDEAHMITREGANAFLKTLEEPPPYAVFVLATTEPDKLPSTIVSRCQRYAFRRIPVEIMIARMREIAAAEGIEIDAAALGALAYRADGGLRDALTMLEQVGSFAGGRPIDVATVDAAFGVTGRTFARALVHALLALDAPLALRAIDEASEAGADMTGLIRGTIAEYRDLLVARLDPELLSRDLAAPDAEAAAALAATVPQPKIVRGLRLLGDALAAGRAAGNPRLELETAVLRLVLQAEDPALDALAARVADLESGARPASGTARPATAAAARSANGAPKRPAADPASAPAAVPHASERPRPAAAAESATAAPATGPASPASASPAPASPAPSAPAIPAPAAAANGRAPAPSSAPPVAAPAAASRPASVSAPPPASAAAPPPASAPGSEPPAPAVPAQSGGAAPAPTLQQVRSLWRQIRLRAEERAMPLRGPLSQATVDALEGTHLTIGLVDEIQASIMRGRVKILEEALADVLQVPLRVTFATRDGRGGESANRDGGEIDLLKYAREKIAALENP